MSRPAASGPVHATFCRNLALAAVLLLPAATPGGEENGRLTALAPSLHWPLHPGGGRPPPASLAVQAPATAVQLFVDCAKGSDAANGRSAAAPLRTLAHAQQLARGHRGSPDGVVVTVLPGVCELEQPLLLTDADSGASESARVIWRGQGATISGGAAPSSWPPHAATGGAWQPASWPGAPASATIWSLDANTWPIEVKTMRTVGGEWVPRSPWPKRAASFTRPSLLPTNYSDGWLSIDPQYSTNGNNTVLPAVASIGLRPHCSDGICVSDLLHRPSSQVIRSVTTVAGPTCATVPELSHTALSGGALKLQTVGAGAAGFATCRAACCANPQCCGWSVAGTDCDPGGAMAPCEQGKPCCWQYTATKAHNVTRIKATCSQTASGPFAPPAPGPAPPPSPPVPPPPPPTPAPPPPPPHVPGYDWGPPTDLYVNDFAGEEADCLNQIVPVVSVNWTSNPAGSIMASLFNAMPDVQPGNTIYNKHEARTGRLFLENVAAALAPGTFYAAANCSAEYKHCGARRGRTIFYWPKDDTASSAPVLPRLYSLVEVRGARHLVLSNFTYRDSS